MRFRPRFSVRTLAVVVTLVCAYFGAWEATAEHAEYTGGSGYVFNGDDVEILEAVALAPFLFRTSEYWASPAGSKNFQFTHRYYLWLYWSTFRLPLETAWEGW